MRRFTALAARLGASTAAAAQALRWWGARQALIAVASGIAVAVVTGLVTVLIPNSLFAREIPPVWWNYPVWILTSALTGILIATYVRPAAPDLDDSAADPVGSAAQRRSGRFGIAGSVLAWFAIGCPVCNKIALLALGYAGALTWFAPVQPVLAVTAMVLSAVAVVWRLNGQVVCPLPAARRRVAA